MRRYSDDGRSSWLEPPFTAEEEAELEWINKPPVSVLKQPREGPVEPRKR
jgi:hypothetical protein